MTHSFFFLISSSFTDQTKNTVLALRARVEEERMAPCRVRFRAKPAPKFTENAQVKLTAASILREDSLYKKKQEKEAAVLKKYESELRDTSEFYRWQTVERKKEEAEKLARGELNFYFYLIIID